MTYLITAIKARELTGISKNVEDRKWEPFIPTAMYTLKKLLGTEGYDILVAAVTLDPTLAGEPELKALRDGYVWPFLAWRTCELSGTRMWAEPDRNGTFTRSSDSYQSVDGKTLSMTKADSRDMAELYREQMEEFLTDNPTDYTWYKANPCEPKRNFGGGVITQPSRGNRSSYPYNDLDGGY
jgi:hypothetical protein